MLFPAGSYTLVASEGRSSSNDIVDIWLGAKELGSANADPHGAIANQFYVMIMGAVAPWSSWPVFTDYRCLHPHVTNKCDSSLKVDTVTFTLVEPTWLRPVYSNGYNAHASYCKIVLTVRPLTATSALYFLTPVTKEANLCSVMEAFEIDSADECKRYASKYLRKTFAEEIRNSREVSGCFYREGDDDVIWNSAGNGDAFDRIKDRQSICRGG